MLDALKSMFEQTFGNAGEDAGDRTHSLALAATALMLEVVRADHEHAEVETAAVIEAARRTCNLDDAELNSLLAQAGTAVDGAVSLQEFTSILTGQLDAAARFELVVDLWRIAYADGRIHKYEDYAIRKIADLLYLSHSDFIRAKHRAAPPPGT
ncbi:MAG: TerB family tellurite resistance protein [Gammaproteobacteria bacterium]|nr:TerB family tellurite resistance protein [Gammaproteobacteria bacterium]